MVWLPLMSWFLRAREETQRRHRVVFGGRFTRDDVDNNHDRQRATNDIGSTDRDSSWAETLRKGTGQAVWWVSLQATALAVMTFQISSEALALVSRLTATGWQTLSVSVLALWRRQSSNKEETKQGGKKTKGVIFSEHSDGSVRTERYLYDPSRQPEQPIVPDVSTPPPAHLPEPTNRRIVATPPRQAFSSRSRSPIPKQDAEKENQSPVRRTGPRGVTSSVKDRQPTPYKLKKRTHDGDERSIVQQPTTPLQHRRQQQQSYSNQSTLFPSPSTRVVPRERPPVVLPPPVSVSTTPFSQRLRRKRNIGMTSGVSQASPSKRRAFTFAATRRPVNQKRPRLSDKERQQRDAAIIEDFSRKHETPYKKLKRQREEQERLRQEQQKLEQEKLQQEQKAKKDAAKKSIPPPPVFGATTSTDVKKDASATKPDGKQDKKPSGGFSFGATTPAPAPNTTTSVPPASSAPSAGFKFDGAASAPSTATTAPSTGGAPSAAATKPASGDAKPSTSKAPAPAFSFGGTPAPAAPAPAAPAQAPAVGGFSFGGTSSGPAPAPAAPAPPAFGGFGSSAKSDPASTTKAAPPSAPPPDPGAAPPPAFSFGAASTTSSTAKPTAAPPPAPTFGTPAAATTTTSKPDPPGSSTSGGGAGGGFSFGSTSSTPALPPATNSAPAPAPAAPTFGGFGASASASTNTTTSAPPSFGGFGSSTTSSKPGTTSGTNSSSAPTFGGFGGASTTAAPASSTTPSFGGFGSSAPAPAQPPAATGTSTAPSFGGSAPAPTSTPAAPAAPSFGGFGSSAATPSTTPAFGASGAPTNAAPSNSGGFGFGGSQGGSGGAVPAGGQAPPAFGKPPGGAAPAFGAPAAPAFGNAPTAPGGGFGGTGAAPAFGAPGAPAFGGASSGGASARRRSQRAGRRKR